MTCDVCVLWLSCDTLWPAEWRLRVGVDLWVNADTKTHTHTQTHTQTFCWDKNNISFNIEGLQKLSYSNIIHFLSERKMTGRLKIFSTCYLSTFSLFLTGYLCLCSSLPLCLARLVSDKSQRPAAPPPPPALNTHTHSYTQTPTCIYVRTSSLNDVSPALTGWCLTVWQLPVSSSSSPSLPVLFNILLFLLCQLRAAGEVCSMRRTHATGAAAHQEGWEVSKQKTLITSSHLWKFKSRGKKETMVHEIYSSLLHVNEPNLLKQSYSKEQPEKARNRADGVLHVNK